MLFIGAQYCPHCAAQRWPLVKALAQFGTFSHLRSSTSSDGIATFDLHDAGYHSSYVDFVHRDIEDRNYRPLDRFTPADQSLFNRYDPYGDIPFILLGGYSLTGDGYPVEDIQGLSFAEIERGLQRRATKPYVADVNGETNTITALICRADGMRPASACNRSAVRAIVAHLR